MFMKRTALALSFILALLFSAVAETRLVNLASAQSFEVITIRADGSIYPSTAPFQRTGNIYTFTGNIKTSIKIERNNIVIDGNGYTLQSSDGSGFYMYPHTNNVTVKNTNIKNCGGNGFLLSDCTNNSIYFNNITENYRSGIDLDFSSDYNSIYSNNITDNDVGITLSSGASHNKIYDNTITNHGSYGIELISHTSYNKIYCNNITNNGAGVILIYSASNNEFYLNNFINNSANAVASLYWGECVDIWDNGTVGNYWSDYNGTDANHDGISDTRYVILVAHNPSGAVREEVNNTDNYPLMAPFDIETNSIVVNSIVVPTDDLLPTALVTATITSLFVVSVGLLVYFKKRKS